MVMCKSGRFGGDLTEGEFSLVVIITIVFWDHVIGDEAITQKIIVLMFLWFLPGVRNDPTHEGTVKVGHCLVAM